MAVLDIITYPASVLRSGTDDVETIDDAVEKLIADMADTMYAKAGIGLAAVQVDSRRRLLIYDISEEREKRNYHVLINPRIISAEGEFLSEKEGCLSLPEFRTDVHRYGTIEVEAQDRRGDSFRRAFENFEAAVLQHEIDHLDGVLLLDHASRLKCDLYKKKVKKLQKVG